MSLTLKVGTIVRIKQFPFTNQAGGKTAPVVVLSSHRYHEEREELIGARISSKLIHKDTFGTVEIDDHAACGLTEPSVIKPVLMTVLINQIQRVVGKLDEKTLGDLRRVFVRDIFPGLLKSS
jgi:hypothetical protein